MGLTDASSNLVLVEERGGSGASPNAVLAMGCSWDNTRIIKLTEVLGLSCDLFGCFGVFLIGLGFSFQQTPAFKSYPLPSSGW